MSESAKPGNSKTDKYTLHVALQVGKVYRSHQVVTKMALNFRYLVAQVNTTNMMKNRHREKLAVKQRKNKHYK